MHGLCQCNGMIMEAVTIKKETEQEKWDNEVCPECSKKRKDCKCWMSKHGHKQCPACGYKNKGG